MKLSIFYLQFGVNEVWGRFKYTDVNVCFPEECQASAEANWWDCDVVIISETQELRKHKLILIFGLH